LEERAEHEQREEPDAYQDEAKAGHASALLASSVSEMLTCQVEEHTDVSVFESVVDHAARSAGADDSGGTQQSQRLGDGRLGRVDRGCQIAHAELAGLEQGVQDAYARTVSEETEEARQALELWFGRKLLPRGLDALGIDHTDGAAVEGNDFR
jgi:hypothetical protein